MTVSHHALEYLDLNEDLVVKSDLNMDFSISGSDSSENCFEFYLRMKAILNEGNLNLRKWISNCAEIMEKKNFFEEQEFGEKIVRPDKFHKVFGILWDFEADKLFFDLKNVSESQISTKHEFLKVLSSLFDLLSIFSPKIITLKMLFQKICMMKINWTMYYLTQ